MENAIRSPVTVRLAQRTHSELWKNVNNVIYLVMDVIVQIIQIALNVQAITIKI